MAAARTSRTSASTRRTAKRPAAKARARRTLDARPDTVDFRDQMFVPTLVEVPQRIALADYRKVKVPILDQGQEGACTGFGLATVANYLLRRRRVVSDATPVSARMLYEMARRYDEWPGEDYEGSSARGAMKGWHRHGVCAASTWPYDTAGADRGFSDARAQDARTRPLGAYFRVNHKDLVAMHSALAEVGVLYATSLVHEGWEDLASDGSIPFGPERKVLGGHAFAIVAYDQRGLWIQNSWGRSWGKGGFARIGYDDWLANGSDVWVARLGAPVELCLATSVATSNSSAAEGTAGYSSADLRPHVVSIGNDGRLRAGGTFGNTPATVRAIVAQDLPRAVRDWKRRRVLLYAHGGLVAEGGAIQQVADYRSALLENQIYPLAFIWKTDFWSTLKNILADALTRRRPEGFLDRAKDFMLDRLDDAIEPLARSLGGKAQWSEMKENGVLASAADGGARLVAEEIRALAKDPRIELHLAAHSAGSIFHAPLVQLLTTQGTIAQGPLKGEQGFGLEIASCTLWAPAITVDLFKQCYLPAIESGRIGRFALYTMTDRAEQDDHCAHIYHKSLLYLVSHAFEAKARIPLFRDGTPILGMERWIRADKRLSALFASGRADWVRTPNAAPDEALEASDAAGHSAFDDDPRTVRSTLSRILGRITDTRVAFHRGAASRREQRATMDHMTAARGTV